MLAKKYRLPVQSTLKKRAETTARGRYFLIKKYKASHSYARIAFVVSTKVSKKAVERNRVRRALYSAAGTVLDSVKVFDYVVIASPTMPSLCEEGESAIVNELKKLL
ncbi:MAG: ribonuclease P protein component [Candidatus Paceibacterota bacterium]